MSLFWHILEKYSDEQGYEFIKCPFLSDENNSRDQQLGALTFSHMELAGHSLFNDNALIPLNSVVRVCKGAGMAQANAWHLYCVFIEYISVFFQ